MEEYLFQGMCGIGVGCLFVMFCIDYVVDQGDEQFGEYGCCDVDVKYVFLLFVQEEGVQCFQVGLLVCVFIVWVEEVWVVLEYQEYQQFVVGEVFFDQVL